MLRVAPVTHSDVGEVLLGRAVSRHMSTDHGGIKGGVGAAEHHLPVKVGGEAEQLIGRF